MKKQQKRKEKRLHLVPLIAGAYGTFLGLGLAVIGLAGFSEGIGIVRFLLGLGMAGLGLYGIWDGVRDFVEPDPKSKIPLASQFIFTDVFGNRSSNVTAKRMQEQLECLMENEDHVSFHLQMLPPLLDKEQEMVKQISCFRQESMIILMAFFENMEGKYRICQKSVEPAFAEQWLVSCLSGSMDFDGWEDAGAGIRKDDSCAHVEGAEDYCYQLLEGQGDLMTFWHQRLIIFGESWHDEHKFFSSKDVVLAIEGVHDGKYQKVVLEWGAGRFDVSSSQPDQLLVFWRIKDPGEGDVRFFAREGTVNQVKFWLVNYLEDGPSEGMQGWSDITAQIEKEWKKHGKIRAGQGSVKKL